MLMKLLRAYTLISGSSGFKSWLCYLLAMCLGNLPCFLFWCVKKENNRAAFTKLVE